MATTSTTPPAAPATVTKERRGPSIPIATSGTKYFGSTITIERDGHSPEIFKVEANRAHRYPKGSYCNSVKQARGESGHSMAIKTMNTQKIALRMLHKELSQQTKGSEEYDKRTAILELVGGLTAKQYTQFAYGVQSLNKGPLGVTLSTTTLSEIRERGAKSIAKTTQAQMMFMSSDIDLDIAKRICSAAQAQAEARAQKAVQGYKFLGEDAFYFVRENKVYLAAPWREGRDLFTFIDAHHDTEQRFTLSAEQRFDIAEQIAAQLKILHEQDIVFCDLKPENVMVSIDPETGKATAHLVDLDSYAEPGKKTKFKSYTPDYLDRENAAGYFIGRAPNISTAMDTYAFGRILGELFSKELNLGYCKPCKKQDKIPRLQVRTELAEMPDGTIEFSSLLGLWSELSDEKADKRPSIDQVIGELATLRKIELSETTSVDSTPAVAAGAGSGAGAGAGTETSVDKDATTSRSSGRSPRTVSGLHTHSVVCSKRRHSISNEDRRRSASPTFGNM